MKSVKEGSAAHYAGLNIGDRLIAVNGDLVSDKSYREVIAAIHQRCVRAYFIRVTLSLSVTC